MRLTLSLAPVLLMVIALPSMAQTVSDDTVAARAGEINFTTGIVTFKRGQSDWRDAVGGDWMKSGDRIATGANSNAEILLTPGSYLRLSANTEVSLDNLFLDQLKLTLIHGSVIVEAASFDKVHRNLATIALPSREFSIDRRGVYRFDAGANAVDTLEVERGEIVSDGTKIKEGQRATADNGGSGLRIESLNAKSKDAFDQWSEQRAKALVAANRTLLRPIIKAPVVYNSASYQPAGGKSIWGGACGGSWYFDPVFGGYTYLPALRDATTPPKSFRIPRGSEETVATVGDPALPPHVYGGQECHDAFSGYGWVYPTFGRYRLRQPHLVMLRNVTQ